MKLSTTPLPANLQDIKLQGMRPLISPFRRSLKKLTRKLLSAKPSRIARSDSGGQSSAESIQSLIGKTNNKNAKLALNLLLVRPWVLVLGFWLFSMMIGSLALSGMLSPRKLTQALPEPTVLENPQKVNAAINVEKAADELAIEGSAPIETDAEADAEADEDAVTAADSGAGFPVLPLTVLVGSCAAGSLLISRRRAKMRLSAARAKGRQSQGRQILKSKTTKHQPSKAQSFKHQSAPAKAKATTPKKRRQRVRRSAVAAAQHTQKKNQSGQNTRVLASRTNAQQSAQQSVQQSAQRASAQQGRSSGRGSVGFPAKKTKQKVSQKKSLTARAQANRVQAKRASAGAKRRSNRVSMRAASRRQPVVSVVPASERHALDWTQGSLTHQMDVRHQRRAM